ncbi:MAG TPA: prepilin peptidase [Verrucomicrobiota bacterium]|nr:prepilin peptidase [Verrucomicrobiota bacterium]
MEIFEQCIVEPIKGASFLYWAVVFFVFGCIVGSFLNVCIYRLPRGESILKPPSHCPNCNWQIPWYFNIPIISYIWLKGKCHNCGKKISPRYVIVEFVTGVFFLCSWLKYGNYNPYLAIVVSIFTAALIVASFIDFEHFIIPDEITIGGIVFGLAVSIVLPSLHQSSSWSSSLKQGIFGLILGAALIYIIVQAGKLIFGKLKVQISPDTKIVFTEEELILPDQIIPYYDIFSRKTDAIKIMAKRVELADRCFWQTQVVLTPEKLLIGKEEFSPDSILFMEIVADEITIPREAMGFGDVKFMAAIGAFTGWKGVVFTLCVSSIIGAIVGGLLIIAGLRERSSRLPYGPFISIAAVIWMFVGEELIRMWLY